MDKIIFDAHIKKVLPDFVTYKLFSENDGRVKAVKIDIDNKYIQSASIILKNVWQSELLYEFVGGTLPILTYVKEYLNIPIVSIGLANEDCNMHGANENFRIELIEKGLEFSRQFFEQN
jgi:acetylornithine deacetylase/succinyl-diaminopimelate desuccinylase-like protein